MLASIVPQTLTVLAFLGLAGLAWAFRRLRLLSTFLWLVVGIDLAFVVWFAIEAYPCTPARCENEQAVLILVFMVFLDLMLAFAFMVAGVLGWRQKRHDPRM